MSICPAHVGTPLLARILGRLVLATTVAAAAVGCGPSVVLPAPAGWPTEVNGRHLYNLPHAYVYATSDAAAGEADGVVRSAVTELSAGGGVPVKGVILVTDAGDGALGAEPDRFHRAMLAQRGVEPCPGDADETFLGMSDALAALGYPDAVPAATAGSELGLPADAVPWVVAIPTRAMIDRALTRGSVKALHDQPDVGWKVLGVAAELLVELPLTRPINRESLAIAREVLVFKQMAARQADWTESKRGGSANEFDRRLTAARMSHMPLMWFPPL